MFKALLTILLVLVLSIGCAVVADSYNQKTQSIKRLGRQLR